MSIIDEALKNVEQTRNADEPERTGPSGSSPGVDGWLTRSSRDVLLVLFGVIVLAAVLAYGWWSRDRLFGSPSTGAVVMLSGDQSQSVNSPAENSTVAAVENNGAAIASASPDQNMALPKTSADDVGDDVARLTQLGVESTESSERTEKLDLASLTAEEQKDLMVSQAASGTRGLTATESQSGAVKKRLEVSVAALTAVTDAAEFSPDVKETAENSDSTGRADGSEPAEGSVATLTDAVGSLSVDNGDSGRDVAALTALPDPDAVTGGANVGRSAEESVAALTKTADSDAGRMAEISASPAVSADDSVDELTAITAAAPPEEAIPAATGPVDAVNMDKAGEGDLTVATDLPESVIALDGTERVHAKTTAKQQRVVPLRQAKLEEALGNHQRALQMLVQGYPEESKLNDDVRRLMARLEARIGNDTRAIELYSQLDPGLLNTEDYFWFGYAYFNVQQWRQAADWFALSSEADEGNVLGSLYQGMALQELGDFQASIDAFHQAREIRPNMPEVAFNTGVSWWALGQRERAVGAFRHFMRVTDGQREQFASQRRRVMQRYLTE